MPETNSTPKHIRTLKVRVGELFKCRHCGELVENKWRNANRKYCSRKCACAAQSKASLVWFSCETCDTRFTRTKGQIDSGRTAGRFCSIACFGPARRGYKNPNYAGGKIITNDGYVSVPGRAESGMRREFEHRVLMAGHLGRELFVDENVHHMNGDRADNRIENLELWSTSQPAGQRVLDKVEWARQILERYGDGRDINAARNIAATGLRGLAEGAYK